MKFLKSQNGRKLIVGLGLLALLVLNNWDWIEAHQNRFRSLIVYGTGGMILRGDVPLTVGTDGNGADVTFYSDTAGDNFLWDTSAEALTITGTNGQDALNVDDGNVDIADDIDVDGTTNLDVVDIDGVTTVGANIVSDTDATDDLGTSSVAFLRAYVDSVFAEHLQAADLLSLSGDSSYIDGGAGLGGTATFTTTDTVDTIAFAAAANVDASSIFVVSANDTSYAAGVGALKGWISKADTLFVRRKPSGPSAMKYSYIRVQ